MASVDARLAALAEAVRRREMEQAAPVDPLSASLLELTDELAGLDELGRAKLLHDLNEPNDPMTGDGALNLTPADVEKFVSDVSEYRRKPTVWKKR